METFRRFRGKKCETKRGEITLWSIIFVIGSARVAIDESLGLARSESSAQYAGE